MRSDYAPVTTGLLGNGGPHRFGWFARRWQILLGAAVAAIVITVGLAVGLRRKSETPQPALSAIAILNNGSVTGTVAFSQTEGSSLVLVTVSLQGVPVSNGWSPGANHGLHIHNSSDLSNSCLSAGPHFNPTRAAHGGRDAAVRHAGDLGNVTADAGGVVRASFSVAGLSLRSTDAGYIIGRSVMLHADADDGGLLNFTDSLTTGHAGARIACGAIVAPLAGGREGR